MESVKEKVGFLGEKERGELLAALRVVPGFPQEGVDFFDLAPLMQNPKALGLAVRGMIQAIGSLEVEGIVALESRGFIFGAAVAYAMELPLILVRKKGKLPGKCYGQRYIKEYGEDLFEMQEGALVEGQRVALVDDILATGGSAAAVEQLVHQGGGEPVALVCLGEVAACAVARTFSLPTLSLLSLA